MQLQKNLLGELIQQYHSESGKEYYLCQCIIHKNKDKDARSSANVAER